MPLRQRYARTHNRNLFLSGQSLFYASFHKHIKWVEGVHKIKKFATYRTVAITDLHCPLFQSTRHENLMTELLTCLIFADILLHSLNKISVMENICSGAKEVHHFTFDFYRAALNAGRSSRLVARKVSVCPSLSLSLSLSLYLSHSLSLSLSLSVCPFIRLSVKRVDCGKRRICPDFYTIWKNI